jgi:hypothetical protein
LLVALDNLSLASLLHEIAPTLYNREVMRWRVLTDIRDELVDRETFAARDRLLARSLATTPTMQSSGPSQTEAGTGLGVREQITAPPCRTLCPRLHVKSRRQPVPRHTAC